MSDRDDRQTSPNGRTLDALVREAKDDLQPKLDDAQLGALEAKLMARLATEKPEESADAPSTNERPAAASAAPASVTSRNRWLRAGAFALAAAAAVAVFVRRDPVTTPGADSRTAARDEDRTAGSLRSKEGAGEVRIGGVVASAGHVLRAGDAIEVDNARAVLERARKVTWLLEHDAASGGAHVARARVKSAGDSLVLGLDVGAIEAQVTPVPSGEAFAVDVTTETKSVRIAVHGTHLRVDRMGSRVVVDLTEGVVSIGAPPRAGSTYGTLVTAPAHVELDANDLEGTLKVDHSPGAVRAAVAFSIGASTAALVENDMVPGSPPKAVAPTPALPGAPPAKVTPAPHPTDLPAAPAAANPAAKAPLPPRDAIAAAVRDCARAKSRSGDVRVTVTSSLRLKVGAKGEVEQAQFDPPLQPEIQTCAAAAIYKVKLEEGATSTTIPIEFSY